MKKEESGIPKGCPRNYLEKSSTKTMDSLNSTHFTEGSDVLTRPIMFDISFGSVRELRYLGLSHSFISRLHLKGSKHEIEKFKRFFEDDSVPSEIPGLSVRERHFLLAKPDIPSELRNILTGSSDPKDYTIREFTSHDDIHMGVIPDIISCSNQSTLLEIIRSFADLFFDTNALSYIEDKSEPSGIPGLSLREVDTLHMRTKYLDRSLMNYLIKHNPWLMSLSYSAVPRPSQKIHINIDGMFKQVFQMGVLDTIYDLKEKIIMFHNITHPHKFIRLIFRGKVLSDDTIRLSDLKISPNENIYFLIARFLPGG